MNNDTAIMLMLADRQRDIEQLRQQVAELEAENGALRAALDEAHQASRASASSAHAAEQQASGPA